MWPPARTTATMRSAACAAGSSVTTVFTREQAYLRLLTTSIAPLGVPEHPQLRNRFEYRAADSYCSIASALALPCTGPPWWITEPGFQPSWLASQPKKNSPEAAESGRCLAVTELIDHSSGRSCGGSKVADTRSRQGVERSHARSTT